ncbi:hypothetical protein LOZ12_003786 [Ophidiomyces ophidiicola]|uniref:Uncharacterized protein n=1 Tax=Ophidiomyces ophidiicola TaxID=1387563 RepID=A0ACB8UUV5_9EURO|nr:hypothetical protein LOZ61_002664 [Ophidiomyces ophidiicola]KAI1914580.1 hypothetical protein LOZ64_003785 [Ophidiomyces ophidiicola]KAI1945671.1 hypothetical protein LOZ62_003645 [Ophidiomyces ophidiicola]KAI2005113.1 hypothetical protein LOZ50_003856 [Ophidiomyces ophidiicola]KAI2006799.1 hypothetical protein LOZ49_004872 [Ophidiomyces ophidiicola]
MVGMGRLKLLDSLNRRYLYGYVPILHLLLFVIEMAITMRLASKFNSYYAERPGITLTTPPGFEAQVLIIPSLLVLTTMVTNAVLGGIADTVAQSITAIRSRIEYNRRNRRSGDDLMSIEIQDLQKEKKPPISELGYPGRMPAPFDFERLTRFMAYGFFMAPVQFQWFGFLSRAFPVTKQHATLPAMKRVAMDQLIFAPIGLVCFFTFMTVAEGGGRRAISRKLQDVYIPTLKANFILWPVVQILNFRLMPIQFQIVSDTIYSPVAQLWLKWSLMPQKQPFVSSIGIAWTAYLSLTNSSDEE